MARLPKAAPAGALAAFPFGFGLSCSAFAYSLLKAEIVGGCSEGGELRFAVTVESVGTMAADEMVQNYGKVPARAAKRPVRMLVAFTRVSLAPGHSERVVLNVQLRRHAYLDEVADAFLLESGSHRVVVARHEVDEGIGMEFDLEAAVVGL